MILVDLNQVMISNMMAQIGSHTNIEVEENLLRHMVLNALRIYKNKFSAEYGELVICCDDKDYWRKKSFPYYKAHRKAARDKSDLDWQQIFSALNNIRDELRDHFGYRFVKVDHAEADDIIGTLCYEYGVELWPSQDDGRDPFWDKILILSGDKDFMQLQRFVNVDQYDPVRKRKLRSDKPDKYLQEHILKGDRGDGVPNFISAGDVFMTGGRQKPLRSSKLNKLLEVSFDEMENFLQGDEKAGWIRNRTLVDLAFTPEEIKNKVLKEFEKVPAKNSLFNYFVEHKLKNLMEHISEF
jgi:hypothetical protein